MFLRGGEGNWEKEKEECLFGLDEEEECLGGGGRGRERSV